MTTFDDHPRTARSGPALAHLGELSELGYVGRFTVDADGLLCCGVCGTSVSGREASVDDRRWLAADGDQPVEAVIAVRCRACGSRGALALDLCGSGGDAALADCLPRADASAAPRAPRRSYPNASEWTGRRTVRLGHRPQTT